MRFEGKRETIGMWEYELPGAREIALEKDVRAGARMRKWNATPGVLWPSFVSKVKGRET